MTHTSTPIQTPSFASVRVVTDHVDALVSFYEQLTQTSARWATPAFAEVVTPRATLAVAGTVTLGAFGDDIAGPAANRSVILELLVDDVDAAFDRLDQDVAVVQPPTTMPWGNRSVLLRDPDGNLVNLFTPVTEEARARAGV
jgi:uncharacterized glyoxalase superfamily protein PhnB